MMLGYFRYHGILRTTSVRTNPGCTEYAFTLEQSILLDNSFVNNMLANLLCELANHRQVFCVTHQPLIAAFADNHFALKKSVISGHTKSDFINLREISDRQRELALLAGGEIVEANAYAASLLEHKAA